MFWRLGFHHRSPIENILEKPNPQVEELLDEEDIIQETKSAGDKLLEFLSKPETLAKLVEFVTVEAPSADDKRKLKYPFVACQVLCALCGDGDTIASSTALSISNTLAKSPDLFGFVSRPPNTSSAYPLLASYFSRVVAALLRRSPQQVLEFTQSLGEKFVSEISKHIGSSEISDLILRLLGCDMSAIDDQDPFSGTAVAMTFNQPRLRIYEKGRNNNKIDPDKISQWWLENKLIETLIDKLDPDAETEVIVNTCNLLSEIIKRFVPPQPTLLADKLKSEDSIKRILDNIMKKPNSSLLLEGISLLSTIVDSASSQVTANSKGDQPPHHIVIIMERIQDFVNLLQNPPTAEKIPTTVGTSLDPPVGVTRLKIVSFCASLFHCKYVLVEKELITKKVLHSCLDLFFTYTENNLLHNQVTQMVSDIITGTSEDVKKALFDDCKLAERIIDANKRNEAELAQPKGMRLGNMAHIAKIGNMVNKAVESQPLIAEIINNTPAWKDFTTSLNEINKLEQKVIGGPTPLSKIQDEDIFQYTANNWSSSNDNGDIFKQDEENRDPDFDARNAIFDDDEWNDDNQDGTFVKANDDEEDNSNKNNTSTTPVENLRNAFDNDDGDSWAKFDDNPK